MYQCYDHWAMMALEVSLSSNLSVTRHYGSFANPLFSLPLAQEEVRKTRYVEFQKICSSFSDLKIVLLRLLRGGRLRLEHRARLSPEPGAGEPVG